MNKNALFLANVTIQDFSKWCTDNNKPAYQTKTKTLFFEKIIYGKLVKDRNGYLVKAKRYKER